MIVQDPQPDAAAEGHGPIQKDASHRLRQIHSQFCCSIGCRWDLRAVVRVGTRLQKPSIVFLCVLSNSIHFQRSSEGSLRRDTVLEGIDSARSARPRGPPYSAVADWGASEGAGCQEGTSY